MADLLSASPFPTPDARDRFTTGMADAAPDLEVLAQRVHRCRRCPRLVAGRESCAADPPKRFRGQRYWGRPLSGLGDPAATVLIAGLAPAAHGGNRTGRFFTGDRSGDWLFGSLQRTSFGHPTPRGGGARRPSP